MFSVAREAIYIVSFASSSFADPHPHNTSLSNPKIWKSHGVCSGCMLGGREAHISVFKFFQWLLLPCEVKCCHDAKQVRLSAFLCIYCEYELQLFFKHSTLPCTTACLPACLPDRLTTCLPACLPAHDPVSAQ
jgi:hypothetical protein